MTAPLPSATLAALNEELLVILAMNGDGPAYGELVRRRQSSIRNLLRRLCRNDSLADDLAQQAFIQGWLSIRQLKSRAAVGAWLRALAVNCWRQQVRGARAETEFGDDLGSETPTARVNRQLDLDAALAQLPAEMRLCLVLAYSEGMSHAEISDAAGIPLGTVKSHITRGAARLRQLLQAYEHAHVG
jgi:RNA polymerase sigma-70 factor (ECF subfamily)